MSTTKIILSNSADWEEWNKRFTSQAIANDLLDHVQGKEALLRKPVKPVIADFPQKARSTMTRSRTQTHTETPDQGPSEQTMSPAPEPREVTVSDLTAEGQKSFSLTWTLYQDDVKTYDKQKELIRKLKDWIATNVSSHYQDTCCKPNESMAKWYENLKKAAGITKRQQEANIRRKYKEALKIPKAKDLITWADSWEQMMTTAKDKNVTETIRASVWFDDFLEAIKGILPMWAEAYEVNKDPQVEDNSLDYHTVANDFRRVAGKHKSTSKIAKGSFGPTFADESSEDGTTGARRKSQRRLEQAPDSLIGRDHRRSYNASDSLIGKGYRGNDPSDSLIGRDYRSYNPSDSLIGKGQRRSYKSSDSLIGRNYRANVPSDSLIGKDSRKYNTNRKRKQDSDSHFGSVCRACEGHHSTRFCYYLFQKKAPEKWTPVPHIQKLVEHNINDDPTLKEEIKRLARNRQGDKENDAD